MCCTNHYNLNKQILINLIIIVVICLNNFVKCDYWTDRAGFLQNEYSQAVGSSINLTAKEIKVNQILMNYKLKEYDDGFLEPSNFLPAKHFFHAKQQIEKSKVFQFIKKLPKGASLHAHDLALVSQEYLYNLTYRDNLYACVVNDRLKLQFFAYNQTNNDCNWRLLEELRQDNSTFDDFVKTQLTLIVDDPYVEYSNINVVWERFQAIFSTVYSFLHYKPVFQDYFYHVLQELYEDNVMYLEFRGTLSSFYELNGTTYSPEEGVKIAMETIEQFKHDYPDFHGVRFIYGPSRRVNNQTAEEYVELAKKLKSLYPDFVAGFDLVGEEDKGRPLRDFIPELLQLDGQMKFFFHAGETKWNGALTDLNLIDAVLLNTTRIGHGYAVNKHPKVLETIKQKNIALEISPISNQVLKLVDDLRNHPAAFLISQGYPIVICCDDPSFWGAKALSYDWYMALMGLASREADLKFLKQLAINSIIYSAMEDKEKANALQKWEETWEKFLDYILISHNVFDYAYNYYSASQI